MKPARLRARALAEWRGLPQGPASVDRTVPVADAIAKVMQSLGLSERLKAEAVLGAWKEVVGDFMAKGSFPRQLKAGVLYVSVLQPSLHFELEHVWKREIVDKLKQRFGAKVVRDVKFRIGVSDRIVIEALELSAHIGVPDSERAAAQRLTVTLRLEVDRGFHEVDDRIERTVDYFAVCNAVKALAAARPRRLIETLGEEIAALVLSQFAVAAVEVELRKFILPDTAFVAVQIRRERENSASS